MTKDEIVNHSVAQSVLLHLLPGILKGCGYWAIVQWVITKGYPSGIALILTDIFILYPFIIIFFVIKSRGLDSWKQLLPYRQSLGIKQYLIWIVGLFLVSGGVIAALGPVSEFFNSWFSWIPPDLHPNMELAQSYTGEYPISILITTCVLGFIFTVLAGPIVEEVYFRGYLLPRIPPMKGFSPLFHSTLFAAYHVWSPGLILARIIGVLPLIYAVQKKKNIYLGIWTHCLLNSVEFFVGAVIIGAVLLE